MMRKIFSIAPYHGLLWLVCGLLGASLFLNIGTAPLRDYRETTYAEIGREMLATHTSFIPHLNGTPHLDKPPLVSWLVTLSFWIGGVSQGTARLPSVLAILWTAGVVGWMAHRSFGPGAGLLAATLWLGTPAAQYYGRMLMTDTIFAALTSTAMAALLEGYLRQHPGWYRLGFVVCGLAVLTRGLPGVVYPLGTLVVFLLLLDRQACKQVPWVSGFCLLLGLAAPWFVLLEMDYPGFLHLFFVQHHLHRLNPTTVHTFVAVPRWHIIAGFAGLLGPLVFLLPSSWRYIRGQQSTQYLFWLLALGVLASVLLATGRNHPYTLPALPPLIALAAAWLNTTGLPTSSQRLPSVFLGCFGGVLLLLLFWLETILTTLSPLLTNSLETLQIPLILVAILLLLSSLFLWQGKGRAAGTVLAMVMLPGAALLIYVQSQLAPQESRASLALFVARAVPPAWPVVIANPRDHLFEGVGAWGFYAQRPVKMVAFRAPVDGPFWSLTRPSWVLDMQDFVAFWNSGQPFVLVATPQALAQLPLPSLPEPLAQDGRFQLWRFPQRHTNTP